VRFAFDAGATSNLLPMANVKDTLTIPCELLAKFQTGFYSGPVDAMFKALGLN
jgi:ATP-dependent Lon protease